jgi:hypothetical protein
VNKNHILFSNHSSCLEFKIVKKQNIDAGIADQPLLLIDTAVLTLKRNKKENFLIVSLDSLESH